MPPTISVIIPAYKAEKFLATAVTSVLSQTLPAAEVLIIDDGSPDSTLAVAQSFGGIVQAIQKPNGGPASARNLGAKRATGEWLAFLDADDAWRPSKLERQMTLAAPEVALIHCAITTGDGRRSRLNPPAASFEDLWKNNQIVTSSVLLRRSVFQQLGGFDEDPAVVGVEDYNLWLRVAASRWQIRRLDEALCVYTPVEGSLTRRTLKFANAELASARKIAAQLRLPPASLEQKELRILDTYTRDLVHDRSLPEARAMIGEALQRRFSLRRLFWYGLTRLPRPVLDLQRRARARL